MRVFRFDAWANDECRYGFCFSSYSVPWFAHTRYYKYWFFDIWHKFDFRYNVDFIFHFAFFTMSIWLWCMHKHMVFLHKWFHCRVRFHSLSSTLLSDSHLKKSRRDKKFFYRQIYKTSLYDTNFMQIECVWFSIHPRWSIRHKIRPCYFQCEQIFLLAAHNLFADIVFFFTRIRKCRRQWREHFSA